MWVSEISGLKDDERWNYEAVTVCPLMLDSPSKENQHWSVCRVFIGWRFFHFSSVLSFLTYSPQIASQKTQINSGPWHHGLASFVSCTHQKTRCAFSSFHIFSLAGSHLAVWWFSHVLHQILTCTTKCYTGLHWFYFFPIWTMKCWFNSPTCC